ncbi:MAG: hypothetical protein WB805_04740, partial [Candidatus Dormiibacterota bacterium]
VDEPLLLRGITHLVEHLALSELGSQPYSYNGNVGPTCTTFHAMGASEELVAFFAHVCKSLRMLPTKRIADHIRILRLEMAGKNPTFVEQFLRFRYGLQHWGAIGFEELALLRQDTPDPQSWADAWFSNSNAVFWISGEPPHGMELDLVDGQRMPVPVLHARDMQLPGWAPTQWPGAGVSMIGPRGAPLTTLLRILSTRAMTELRYGTAMAYQVTPSYLALDAQTAHMTLGASVIPETAAPFAEGLDRMLRLMAYRGISQADLDSVISDYDKADHSNELPQSLLPNAQNELMGFPLWDASRQRDELTQVVPEDLTVLLQDMLKSRIVVTSPGVKVTLPLPVIVTTCVPQKALKTFKPKDGKRRDRLYFEEHALRYEFAIGVNRSIPWKDVVVLGEWTNGQLLVNGRDGFTIVIHPREWGDTKKIASRLREAVPDGVRVTLDPSLNR